MDSQRIAFELNSGLNIPWKREKRAQQGSQIMFQPIFFAPFAILYFGFLAILYSDQPLTFGMPERFWNVAQQRHPPT